jgi:hypothetical protein
VALSGDGGAALVGAPGEGRYVGAAWAYGRSGSSWAQEGPKLVPPELSPGALFGSSLAVSADGDTALAGAPADIPAACRNAGGYAGGVWTFTRAGGMWTQQEARLAVRGACEGAFGTNIALSSDGDTALVVDRSGVLAFARSHSTWTQRGPSFPCVDGECGFASGFALSVALSGDGDVALIGATPREECGKYMDELCAAHGLVWTYHRFATTWVRQGPALQGPLGFGSGVALSGAADGALTGGSGGTLASLLTPPPPNSFSTGQLTASRNGVLDQRLASSAAGTFTAVARVSRGRLRLPHGSPHRLIGYGEGVASASGPGIVNLKIKPRRVVRHALFKHRSIQPALHITISFRPSAGTAPAKQTLTAPLERH